MSEFALPKDVVPEFQVWNGKERLGKAEEQRLVNNENMEAIVEDAGSMYH